MTDKEAMAMALEALECANSPNGDYENEIAALKERLAQEKALQALHNENERLGLYKDAYAEQEPVAWGVFEGNLHDMFFTQSEAQEMAKLKGTHAEVRPFYTTPPQRTEHVIDKSAAIRIATALGWTPPRTWVDLTAEEVLQCWERAHEPGNKEHINAIRMADEVEAKLKEVNT